VTIDSLVAQAIKHMKQGILVALLFVLAVTILKIFGVTIPVRTPGHIELAYLAGSYWLIK
jgi:uncharacterized membrane protein